MTHKAYIILIIRTTLTTQFTSFYQFSSSETPIYFSPAPIGSNYKTDLHCTLLKTLAYFGKCNCLRYMPAVSFYLDCSPANSGILRKMPIVSGKKPDSIVSACQRLQEIAGDCRHLLENVCSWSRAIWRICQRLPELLTAWIEISSNFWRLQEITGIFWRMLMVATQSDGR